MANLHQVILVALPVIGMLFLIAGLRFSCKICSETRVAKPLWQCLFGFILCFLVGYVIYIYNLLAMEYSVMAFSVSFIYFAGGAFVFLVAFSTHKTLYLLNQSQRFEIENKSLAYLASHDHLTGLINRGAFESELDRVVNNVNRGGPHCALLFVDLDGFKQINDRFGHAAGDYLLQEVASFFQEHVRVTDFVSRFGGDEFVILLYNIELEYAVEFAEKLSNQLRRRVFSFEGNQLKISGSIGISPVLGDRVSATDIMAKADSAVYQSKVNGLGKVTFHQ